ncbi:arginase family protein [Mesonia maritima]|uniref:Arginase family enzyme n=1 Tax=Mesonia maritima TaxID=1793873 RepID=A0ABU1K4X3_9FLAO|nr:arginase family protein [Mesonia maritima]MDR6300665.1 arginase family enzyme [Mesonia maritima]
MNNYYLSPFFSVKNVFNKCYLEHKFTKKIIVIPNELSKLFSEPYNKLFGLEREIIYTIPNELLEVLIEENIILKRGTTYKDISSFFVRPQVTYLGLPFMNIDKVFDKIALFGVPYKLGNDSESNLNKNNTIARKYGNKYNLNIHSYNYSAEIKKKTLQNDYRNVCDIGDVFINPREFSDLSFKKISNFSKKIVNQDNKFIAIGGDHSITYPLFNGVKRKFNDLVCIHIDAHNDLFLSSECFFYDLVPSHSSVIAKLLLEENEVHSLGLRDYVNIDSLHLTKIPNYFFHFSNSNEAFLNQVSEIITKINKKKVYITLDMDVLDPKFYSSVTDPLPNGISPNVLMKGLQTIFSELEVIGLDIVEANLKSDNVLDTHFFLDLLIQIIDFFYEK